MSQIIYNKTGGRIVFDQPDWLGGLHPQYNTGSLVKAYNNASQLAAMRAMNPFRNIGFVTPGFRYTDVTNVSEVTDKILNGAVSTLAGAYCYLVTAGAKLQKLDLTSDTLSISYHTITGSSPVGEDIVAYNIGTTQYLFYSYNTTTGNIGRLNTNDTFIDDYLTNASYLNSSAMGNNPHPMMVGSDDRLYVADGNQIHQLNGQSGANGTWTANFFTLPYDAIITSFAKIGTTQPYLVIFAYKNNFARSGNYYRGEAYAYFWDYASPDASKVVNLQDNYVIGGFNYKNTIGCFTQGRRTDPTYNKPSKLKLYNPYTGEFESKAVFDQNVPLNGGVDVVDNQIMFLTGNGSQSNVWSYGAPVPGTEAGLNIIGEGIGTAAGFLRVLTSTSQYASTGTTTSGGLQNISTNYNPNAFIKTLFVEPEFPEQMYGRVRSINVFYGKTSSGGLQMSMTLNNRITNYTIISNVSTIDSNNINKNYRYDSSNNTVEQIKFGGLQVGISYSGTTFTDAPIPSRIEIDYDNVTFNP